ncbi:MAG: alpha-2-macroglobulin, partial [Deltaproteobacteria bacterium]|nr:alpha-2-macroglobulin [Deltaproteobacteria bacterium]
ARVGLVKLPVERATRRLAVAVKADKADYRPGDEVTVGLSVQDFRGAGTKAEVTLYVVDEAVLRLTSYEVPDPVERMFPDRPLSVRTSEPLLNLVRRRSFGEKGEPQGGGGGSGEGAGIRSNFRTTALFSPTVETDAQGRASVKFKLPDNLTEFRLMAVAVSGDDRYGSGQGKLTVSKPVLALPSLPRFARVGDTFEAGVVVYLHGGQPGEARVTAEVEGVELQGPAEQKVPLQEGKPREVRFAFKAGKPGTARFVFRVERGADKDGVQEKIPVELPVGLETVATYGDTSSSRVEGVVPPKDVLPDQGGLKVTLASTSLTQFQQGMEQLVEYPYGCLEQQSSRLVPFVALRELAGQFKLPWPKGKASSVPWLRAALGDTSQEPDEVIRRSLKALEGLQAQDGSFRYWPGSSCSDSWTSAWATFALARARSVGFEVDPEVLNKAHGFVQRVAAGTCSPCEQGCPLETQVFAGWVGARTGRPQASNYGRFYDQRQGLSLFARALLADALFVGGGDRAKAKGLLQELLNHAKESARGLHFEEIHSATYAPLFHSDTRTTGVVLMALTDIQPDHP